MEYLKIIIAIPNMLIGIINLSQAFFPFRIDEKIKKRIEDNPETEEKFMVLEEKSKVWGVAGRPIQILSTALPCLIFAASLVTTFLIPQSMLVIIIGISALLLSALALYILKNKAIFNESTEVEKSIYKTVSYNPKVNLFFSALLLILCF